MSKLKLEVLFNAIDKVSGPIKTIIGGSQSMSAALKKTNSELKGLESQQRKITGFRQLSEQSEKTAQALAKNKQTIIDLKQAMNLGAPTEKMVKDLQRAESAQKRLTAVQKSQSKELTGMAQDFNKSGLQMNRLGDEESNLKNKIHLTTMELNKQKEALGKHDVAQKKYEKMQSRMAKANDIAKKGLIVAGAGIAALAIPVKLAIDFESATADVKKVIDFDTPQQFKEMERDILNMSKKLPMAAKDIAAIYAAGGQSGIAKNELGLFAETAVKMGVAFDTTAEESGQAMAEMRTAFKMSQVEVTSLADKINYLGNNTPAAAKGIMNIVQRIGPLGEVGGFAAGSIAALGATIRGMGVNEEIAATGIKNMMLALTAGESATKSQQLAFKELGLDSTKIAKSMQVDSEKTTLSVLKSVSKLEKYKQASVLKDLFGSESLGSIAPLLTNMEALEKNLNMVGDASKYAGSMEAEYAARAATTENNTILAKNAMAALGITIGNQLLPGVNSITEKFTGVINLVQNWAQENPALASTLVKVAVGAIAIVGGLSALSIGLITVFGPMMMVAKGFGVVALAARAMSMALLTNPIAWIVLAIAGAAFLIYKYWGPISSFFSGIWDGIKSVFSPIGTWFTGKITEVKNAFSGGIKGISSIIINWSPIGLFYSAFAKVLSWFGIDLPAKFTGFGGMILEGLKNGILSKVGAVKEALSNAVTGVIDKAKGILGIHSPSRVFMGIGGYTMQGMANGITQSNNLPITATRTATEGLVSSAVKTQAVKPISFNSRNNAKTYISQDEINITIQVKDGSIVKGTAEAMRQELRRVAQEEQNKKRKFLTDSE